MEREEELVRDCGACLSLSFPPRNIGSHHNYSFLHHVGSTAIVHPGDDQTLCFFFLLLLLLYRQGVKYLRVQSYLSKRLWVPNGFFGFGPLGKFLELICITLQ